MNIVNNIFQNGSIWALVGTLLYVFSELEPVLKAHLRNEHAKSLLAAANRIVPSIIIIMKIQEARQTVKVKPWHCLMIMPLNVIFPLNSKSLDT